MEMENGTETPIKIKENRRTRAASLGLTVTAISFIGYWFENVFVALTDGYMDNRNMMLPFLLGYGLGMVAIYLVFGTPREPKLGKIKLCCSNTFLGVLYYFAVVFVCVSVGELLLGNFVEAFFNITWWDYSFIPLHFTKFTSVPTSIGFTVLIMGIIHFFFERLYFAFVKINKKLLYTLAIVFMILMTMDFVISGFRMYTTQNFVRIWRIDF